MDTPVEFQDVRNFFTAIAEHSCGDRRVITSSDLQGTSINNTFIGFKCDCGACFRLALAYVKSLRHPMRPYVVSTANRVATAERLTREPQMILMEMRNSGGWDQPDPGVAMITAMAAAFGPKGNPMGEKLKAMMGAKPKPS